MVNQLIQWNSQVRYLGVFFDSHLKWSTQCRHVAAKATHKLNLLRRSLFGCPSTVKSLAFISIVRLNLEYASVVWNPYASADVNLLEAVQNQAACWIHATWDPATYSWSKSSRTCLSELTWPSLAQHRTYFIVDYLHSILHKMNSWLLYIQLGSYKVSSFDDSAYTFIY